MRASVRRLSAVVVVALAIAGCSDKPSASPSPNGSNTFDGTWIGAVGSNAATAVLSQSGRDITGTVAVNFFGPPSATGTVSGTFDGSTLTLTVTFPAGAFSATGSATCSMEASGTSSATTSAISMNLTQNWTPPCLVPGPEGALVSATTNTAQWVLNKQRL